MTEWKVPFKNDQGQEVWKRPLIREGGNTYFEDASGIRHIFSTTAYQHPTLGRLTPGKPIPAVDLPPEPFDPAKEELIATLDGTLRKIPTNDYDPFLNDQPKLRKAINAKFARTTTDQLTGFVALIEAEIERLATARIAQIPERIYSRDECRINFCATRLGSLFVEENIIPSCTDNNWNGTFRVRCDTCGTLHGEMFVLDILKVKNGELPVWTCKQPCVKGGK